MRRDDVHQTGQRDHAEQALAHLLGVAVGEHAQQQWALNTSADAVELPRQVTDEGVALADGTVTKTTTEPGV